MELYFKNSNGQLQETNLRQILSDALKTANFEMDNGSFDGENHKWIGVVQKSKNKTKQKQQNRMSKPQTSSGIRTLKRFSF